MRDDEGEDRGEDKGEDDIQELLEMASSAERNALHGFLLAVAPVIC